MAIISTRKPEADDSFIVDLQKLIEENTGGAIGFGADAIFSPGETREEILDTLRNVHITMENTIDLLNGNLYDCSIENLNLEIQAVQSTFLLQSIQNVEYDDALDHATLDLMDAFVAAAIADCNDDGKIVFDTKNPISKSELKPILYEAITRWVEQKFV